MYDILILGGGPAGYMAAIHGAQEGKKVAVIEEDKLGGTCLNWGCIPTKTLVEGAKHWSAAENAEKMGVFLEQKKLDMGKMIDYKDEVSSTLRQGLEQLMKINNIDVYNSRGQVDSLEEEKVIILKDGKEIKGENLIIATGSKNAVPPIEGVQEVNPLTSNSALDLREVPRELIIIGAGVIGLEMACIYAKLGSKVTVLEMMDQVIPGTDKEIAKRLLFFLKKRGIKIETSAMVKKITGKSGTSVEVTYEQKGKEKMEKGQHLLLSAGRIPALDGLPFDSKVEVDEFLRTKWLGVYAAGDVIGGYQLAHVAYYEGITAVNNILGQGKSVDYSGVPNSVFTDPPLATAGLTEEEAKDRGLDYEICKFPYSALGRAMTSGNIEGMVKLIVDRGANKVLGMHIIGSDATEIIHVGAAAVRLGVSLDYLEKIIFAHPTYSEAVGEIFHMAQGHYYHTPKR